MSYKSQLIYSFSNLTSLPPPLGWEGGGWGVKHFNSEEIATRQTSWQKGKKEIGEKAASVLDTRYRET